MKPKTSTEIFTVSSGEGDVLFRGKSTRVHYADPSDQNEHVGRLREKWTEEGYTPSVREVVDGEVWEKPALTNGGTVWAIKTKVFGFFSVVWCEHPDRMEHSGANARPLFPDGAMMIRARTSHHLEHLQCDLMDAILWAMDKKPALYRDVCDRWGVHDQMKEDPEIRLDEALHGAIVTMFPILEQPGSDYQYRIFMERDLFAFFMEWRSQTIDYRWLSCSTASVFSACVLGEVK